MKRRRLERWLDVWGDIVVFVLSVMAAAIWLWPVVVFLLRATEPQR